MRTAARRLTGTTSPIYERPFEVVYTDTLPEAKDSPRPAGGHFNGCRIGFDAGGSDRKVSAVVDGETVYSEEVVWFPKTTADPDYHYDGIVAALRTAAEHMPRVDAVGVSSAGVYINNRTMNASLFLKVPQALFDAKVKDIYIRAITDTFGDVPFCIFNDGDVTLKRVVEHVCGLLGIDVKNASSYYARIRRRKADERTYFIDRLREVLLKRMEEDDEKHYRSR